VSVADSTVLAFTVPDELVERIAERAAELLAESPRYLSRAALASRYGVSERRIRTWRERGLPGIRCGKTVMFRVEDCDRWIETQA
jgi:hypothetical protein